MKKFIINAIFVAMLIIIAGVGCGSSSVESEDSGGSEGETAPAGAPEWIKGDWFMTRWNGETVTRFNPIMTVAETTFTAAFNDIGQECVSDGSFEIDGTIPSWESNEYSMIVSETTCTVSWGPASLAGDFDQGIIFAEDERFMMRVSYLFPDFWEYRNYQ
ncbi:hypothetical protein MNBD_NITROSPINAE02-1364 [hydrothermal vent metagenome]|uniref:Lipocalin-like domain-containing protein n=1 Tax=hydrothermal vent metagenome TaxID=652676 RepID=A0A3B1C7J9_9ZZZZ